MLTKAVRLHGKNDLRLDTFELPEIQDDEILVKVISDSICMSTYKAAIQGTEHKRVPADVAEHPTIMGHEFSGVIVKVGSKWAHEFKEGEKFGIQPAINYKGSMDSPGYSFRYIGGDTQYAIVGKEVLDTNSLLHYRGKEFFFASLSEPLSCIIGAFHAQYHTKPGVYVHEMGIVPGGSMALLACAGPMGLGAIDYAIHCDRRPGLLVVTDIDQAKLDRAASIYTVEDAARHGVRLIYMNTAKEENPVEALRALTDDKGFDDVFVFAPVSSLIEQGDQILGRDGCLNFFAGPTDHKLSARFNFYEVHYGAQHLVGTSGGNTEDMKEALHMIAEGRLNPAGMITHVGGLDAAAEATLNLPHIPGGKKLIYPQISLPLTAIDDFAERGKTDPLMKALAEICARHNGLWSGEAEEYLLAHAKSI
ncbi:MAG: zinc-binding dehydrogenase [Eubacteriales bacterium]|nr:zinc-binding dehydrogenase [Eubacteriales bacterium]